MKDHSKAIVWGAFAGDALALGAHWVYNTHVIDAKLGLVERYAAPLTTYHKGKQAGELTHYGDQMLWLLELLGRRREFDGEGFTAHWQALCTSYAGYVDQATKATLANLAEGRRFPQCGSTSDDLGGAARIAPLVYRFRKEPAAMAAAVRAQTAATHHQPDVIQAAELFGRATLNVLEGEDPSQALLTALKHGGIATPLAAMVEQGLASRGQETRAAIAGFGQMCALHAALPATVHLIATYAGDLRQALIANVMAGGDSAARGMLAGMVLGAQRGIDAIPQQWLQELTARQRIAEALNAIDAWLPNDRRPQTSPGG
jgi:ADP-ribosylglycohydrolase